MQFPHGSGCSSLTLEVQAPALHCILAIMPLAAKPVRAHIRVQGNTASPGPSIPRRGDKSVSTRCQSSVSTVIALGQLPQKPNLCQPPVPLPDQLFPTTYRTREHSATDPHGFAPGALALQPA